MFGLHSRLVFQFSPELTREALHVLRRFTSLLSRLQVISLDEQYILCAIPNRSDSLHRDLGSLTHRRRVRDLIGHPSV